MMPTRTAISRNGVPIRLTDERWSHVLRDHPEVADYVEDVLLAIAEPDEIRAGDWGALISLRLLNRLYLTVVYRETALGDGFIITAYLARRPMVRTILWTRA